MIRPQNHSNLLIIKDLSERVEFETIVQRSFICLASGRWRLSRLIQSSSVLTARKWHGRRHAKTERRQSMDPRAKAAPRGTAKAN
jgi:hypothetical protein